MSDRDFVLLGLIAGILIVLIVVIEEIERLRYATDTLFQIAWRKTSADDVKTVEHSAAV